MPRWAILLRGTSASCGPAGRARTRVGYTDNARTVWHFGGAVEEIRPDATGVTLTQVRVPGPLGMAVSLRTDSGGNTDHVYSHGDGRGSRFFTNRTGDVVQDVTYSLFGRVVEDTGTPSSLSYTDDLWNGGDHFPEVGITILGARAYDVEHGELPGSTVVYLVRKGTVQFLDVPGLHGVKQLAFHPDSFPLVNKKIKWLTIIQK